MLSKLLGMKTYFYVAGAAFAVGFAWAFYLGAVRFAEFEGGVRATGEMMEKIALEKSARDKQLKKELEDAHKKAIQESNDKFASLYSRYAGLLNDPGGRIVPEAASSAGRTVREGEECYDKERLDREIRLSLDRVQKGLIQLLREGAEALIDRAVWERFGLRTDACSSQ